MTDVKDTRLLDRNMTMDEFRGLVEAIVEQKLVARSGYTPSGSRAEATQLLASMWQHIIKAEPDAPSPLTMLREEREQWYKPT